MNRRGLLKALATTAANFYLIPNTLLKVVAATDRAHGVASPTTGHVPAQDQIDMPLDEKWEVVLAGMVTTPSGRLLAAAIDRSGDELRALILNHRRVAAVWQRVSGLEWTEKIFQCLYDQRRRCPREDGGRRFQDALRELAVVLSKYGSAGLARDTSILAQGLMALPDRSYQEVLAMWRSNSKPLEEYETATFAIYAVDQ
jgi:hypothetical protein